MTIAITFELVKQSTFENIKESTTNVPTGYHRKQFKWSSGGDGNEDNTKKIVAMCRNTVQGQNYITDDRGYVCERRNVDPHSGCCAQQPLITLEHVYNTNNNHNPNNPPSPYIPPIAINSEITPNNIVNNDNNTENNNDNNNDNKDELLEGGSNRFSCAGCNLEYRCCQNYEFCVSCCLGTDKKQHLESILEKEPPFLASVHDQFEMCTAMCRTSSRNLVHEREYKSQIYKYCFTDSAPSTKKRKMSVLQRIIERY